MWLLRFLKSNFIYLIWFSIYFSIAWYIFGANRNSFIIVSVIYAVSITVALSPLGEIILRLVENCRIPATEQEKNYLIPIFEEVYQNAKEVNPSLNNGIKIYIMDAMYINAFAIGRKTIAVTRGAMETFKADELKGLIAHELGHMTYGHSKALLLTLIGNFLFTVIVFVLRIILNIVEFISEVTAYINIVGIVFRIVTFVTRVIFEVSIFVFVNLGDLLLSMNSRVNEYEADKFAYTIGLGRELTTAMYLLQKISINTKMRLSEKMKATHPHIADRIAQLEKLENLACES